MENDDGSGIDRDLVARSLAVNCEPSGVDCAGGEL
jgi:hypothetical protein